jgi:hypothetical protein
MSLGICYNGKRKVVKCTPTMSLQAILEEATNFYNLDVSQCKLVKGKNTIDLSLPFRFSGLQSNSNLDLVVDSNSSSSSSPSNVPKCRIALSVEGNAAMPTTIFPATTRLVDIIHHFVKEGKLSAQVLESKSEAVIIYLQSHFRGAQLEATTLSGLGLSGQSARLQLRFSANVNHTQSKESQVPKMESHLESKQDDDAKSAGGGADMDVEKPSSVFASSALLSSNSHAISSISSSSSGGAAELKALLQENFDAVSKPALITLSKYLFNMWASPLEPKYRMIFTDNRTFGEKVAPCTAALRFLASIGFISESINGRDALKLPLPSNVSEDAAADLLKPCVKALEAAMDELNISFEDRPQAIDRNQLALQRRQQQQMQQQQPAFDPYKTMVRRVADVNPDGSVCMTTSLSSGRSSSATETRLAALQARKDELQGNPEDASSEQTQVVLPNLDAGSSSAQSKSYTNSLQWDDIDDNISDSKVLAASIGHTLRNKREDAPLTTAAIRAVKKAEGELVYTRTLIRIRFPDRIEVQKYLHPRNTMNDVYQWVRSCLNPQIAHEHGHNIELYITPPRQVLHANSKTLEELKVVPAVLLNLKWLGSNIPHGDVGHYFRDDLLQAAGNALTIPTGTPLVPDATARKEIASTGFGSMNSGSSSSSDAPKKKTGTGKPAWFKL